MSRNQALRRWRGRAVVDELDAKGILIRSHSMRAWRKKRPVHTRTSRKSPKRRARGLAKRVAALRRWCASRVDRSVRQHDLDTKAASAQAD